VAAFGFNERRGAKAQDASGHRRAGRVRGARRAAKGRYGRALLFDGRGDVVTIPGGAKVDLASGMTLEAWVMPSGRDASWRPVVVRSTGRRAAFGLFASVPAGRVAGMARTQRVASARGQLRPGVWSHLALTYAADRLSVFVDGRLVGQRRVRADRLQRRGPLLIGGTRGGRTSFRGKVDEVRLYDRGLSPAELLRDMATPVMPSRP
jgi:hypothetical protein